MELAKQRAPKMGPLKHPTEGDLWCILTENPKQQGERYDPKYNPPLGAHPIDPILGNIGVDVWRRPFQTTDPPSH